MTKLISVIIPTYNRANLIKDSIQSVLCQTYKNFELLIIDDGSTDETYEIISELKDKRIRYIKQENSGACSARNNGIKHAHGDYIAFHDSDDIWHKDKLQNQIDCINNIGADVVCCRMNRYFNGVFVRTEPFYIPNGFLNKNMSPMGISTQTIFGRAEVFKTVLFDEKMPRLQDFEIMLRVMMDYSVYVMSEAKVDSYVQNDSISSNPKKFYDAVLHLMKTHGEILLNKTIKLQLGENLMRSIPEISKTEKKLRNEMGKLSLKLDKSIKNLFRYILFKFHLYDIYFFYIQSRREKK